MCAMSHIPMQCTAPKRTLDIFLAWLFLSLLKFRSMNAEYICLCQPCI